MKPSPSTSGPMTSRFDADHLLRTQRDLFQAVATCHDHDRTLRLCLEAALQVTAMECGGLYLADEHGGLHLEPTIGLSEEFVAAVNRLPPERANTRLVMGGQPLYLGWREIDAIPSDAERRERLRSLAVVPILLEERVIGSLNVASRRLDEVPQHARPALETIGAAASMLIAREQADKALRATARRLQRLSRRLLAIQEEERRRLARELHDEIGQQLTGLVARLEAARRSPASNHETALDAALTIAEETLEMIGDLSLEMRPSMLDDYGLPAALRWHGERIRERAGIEVGIGITGIEGRLAPDVETAAFRIVQEALTNVVRHARVKIAQVRLWVDGDRLHVEVADEGRGFDPWRRRDEAPAFGLSGMRERAELLGGSLQLESEPGRGTRVLATLPLSDSSRRETSE